ncbi:MAG TPA: methionine adenosyltransferase [Nitrospiraceae bacterium]|nr:methionine adenosyltransferase [Nitrospiraceae bacterium]
MIKPTILQSTCLPLVEQPVEIVERKGIGHPDTICDAAMEQVSIDLSRAYREACGRVLHFNADKGLLVAGQVDCRLGGGFVISPMRMVIGDRATFEWKRTRVPVVDIAERAVYRWFRRHLPLVKPIKDVVCQVELKPASAELRSVAERKGEAVANDTSAAVGYAPLTPTERLVLQTELFLNGSAFKKEFPDTGQDVKVLGMRTGGKVMLTVAMPLLSPKITRASQYFARKAEIVRALRRFAERQAGPPLSIAIGLNVLDCRGQGIDGMYLTLLGTSAESGDSGEVGRGNRVCGVISLRRPSGAEAAAGKNPMTHVGKIYNVLAQVLAEEICHKVRGLREVSVWMTSQIGRPIAMPFSVVVEANLAPGVTLAAVDSIIRTQVGRAFSSMGPFCKALSEGVYGVW